MLPTLVLAGACITVPTQEGFVVIALAAVAARLIGKLVAAEVLARAEKLTQVSRLALGLGLLPAGALTMAVGLACTLRFPGPIGDAVLALAAINVVFGELVGPATLRRTLRLAGEIPDSATLTPFPRPRPKQPERPRRPPSKSRGSFSGIERPSDPKGAE